MSAKTDRSPFHVNPQEVALHTHFAFLNRGGGEDRLEELVLEGGKFAFVKRFSCLFEILHMIPAPLKVVFKPVYRRLCFPAGCFVFYLNFLLYTLVSSASFSAFAEGTNKLHEVLPNLGEDLHRRGEGAGRKRETAMCRLRVGHPWLTQSYLLKNEQPPFCYACDSLYTVRHILIECPDFQDTRRKCFSITDLYRLFREVNPSRIVGYLKDFGVYGNI
ncbi:ribonuclease hi [Plakobranchus ocellatus]|uniref:Ribonuclease hi n=1 Tax=Plakobranchus ocellatus TaxID=259542 RepID=A0AAV3Z7J7_9GAST|nr:ribonuclease hi [Plakobranchus ocellatus]